MSEEPKEFSKYEKARIIGNRALQISEGAPLLLKLTEAELEELKFDPISIAKKEFEAGIIPLDVVRELKKPKEAAE
jgi:DNA-directed RNA polymerase subunit K/omega